MSISGPYFVALFVGASFLPSFLSPPLSPQDKVKADEESTQLELISSAKGTAFVKSYEEMGTLKVLTGGTVSVDALVIDQLASGSKQFGATVQVKQPGRIEREDTSFVDYEEIEALIAGIGYISKVADTPFTNYEATFNTTGGITLIVFNNDAGKVAAAIKSGRIGGATAFASLEQLESFRELLVKTKEAIDQIR